MKPSFEGWTIVVSGLWNVRIFTPQWVAKNAFQANEIETEIRFGAAVPSLFEPVSLRYRHGNLSLLPSHDRLIIGMTSAAHDALEQGEAVILRIVGSLPHTPVNAFGINFSYIEEDPSAKNVEIFKLSDAGILPYEVEQTEVIRRLKLDDGVLNLKHTFDQKVVRLDFNFHHEASAGSEQVVAKMPGSMLRSHEVARRLIELYDFELEKDADAN